MQDQRQLFQGVKIMESAHLESIYQQLEELMVYMEIET
jgi:hypothetical protein